MKMNSFFNGFQKMYNHHVVFSDTRIIISTVQKK